MKISPSCLLVSLVTAGLILATSGQAAASPRSACELLPLATIRGLVGSPVSVFDPASSVPTMRDDTTFSTCTFLLLDAAGHPAKGRSGRFTLMWAPRAKLAQTNEFYAKRHIEAPALKGDVLVLAWVGNSSEGKTGDWPASQKLLAAVLEEL